MATVRNLACIAFHPEALDVHEQDYCREVNMSFSDVFLSILLVWICFIVCCQGIDILHMVLRLKVHVYIRTFLVLFFFVCTPAVVYSFFVVLLSRIHLHIDSITYHLDTYYAGPQEGGWVGGEQHILPPIEIGFTNLPKPGVPLPAPAPLRFRQPCNVIVSR